MSGMGAPAVYSDPAAALRSAIGKALLETCAHCGICVLCLDSLVSENLHTASRATCACKALGAKGSCNNKLHNALGP